MNLQKKLALLLAALTLFSLVACGPAKNVTVSDPEQVEDTAGETDVTAGEEDENVTDDKKPATDESKKPADDKKPVSDPPATKPQEKPVEKPAEKPVETPDPTPSAPKTVGQALLADFKAKAGAASSAASLAEALVANPILPFAGATMPVEPGFLAGFDNAEIKGFSEGVTFGPVIGSVPFIGYVFVLENGVNASDFIATLQANANLRWNICVEAEEMVSGHVGNKVFFVMSPKEFTEE
ncbi:MAG: hypothetical protein E7402_00855 [Ruminococcaceae bacterium]|nr:hypothetical protein [Oscillospiraceae bacterium]